MAKKHKCDDCGCEMEDTGYQGYCYTCYEKKWDSGIESTSDHAYKLGFDDLVQKLDGPWGAPSMFRLEGGSIGFQLGGSATDFVLLVVNPRGVDSLLKSKVKLGADAMAAAGPKGRSATAETDALMTAEILSYSRSKGLFAGVSLKGSTLRQDSSANEDLYNSSVTAREIVLEGKVTTPASAKELVALLQEKSPKNLSK